MRDFFNGKSGLAATYWLGVFGVGFVTRLIFRFVNKGYLTIQDDAKFAQLEMFHNVFLVALCIYMLLMVRAMIKAGFDNRRPGGWGWIGITLTILSTLYILYATVTVLFPSTATPRFMLELELRQLNKQLPQDMGDGFVMTQVKIENDVVFYHITVDGELDEFEKQFYRESMMNLPEGKEVCQDFEGYFIGGITAIAYSYKYDNETIRQDIVGSECLEWLAEQ